MKYSISQDNSPHVTLWEERPAGNTDTVWRYTGNPVISWNPIPCVARIYNSAMESLSCSPGQVTAAIHHSEISILYVYISSTKD